MANLITARKVAAIAIALFLVGVIAWTMTSMLAGMPAYVSVISVWPFIGFMLYSIVSKARGRS